MGFKTLLTYWQEQGLDPALLGQPQLWIHPEDKNYLLNTSSATPSNGQTLLSYGRYSDNGLTFTRVNATNNTTFFETTNLDNFNYIQSISSPTSNTGGQYVGGTTTTFANLHKGQYTVYWVWRTVPTENITTNKFVLGTAIYSSSIGAFFGVGNGADGTTRGPLCIIYRGVVSSAAVSYTPTSIGYNSVLSTYQRTDADKTRVWSWRMDLTGSTGSTAMRFYQNGIADGTASLLDTPSSSSTSATALNIGNRSTVGTTGRFVGSIGELIIFDTLHDEFTHEKVCNFLKRKYRATN